MVFPVFRPPKIMKEWSAAYELRHMMVLSPDTRYQMDWDPQSEPPYLPVSGGKNYQSPESRNDKPFCYALEE
jgi:hypothetical protein